MHRAGGRFLQLLPWSHPKRQIEGPGSQATHYSNDWKSRNYKARCRRVAPVPRSWGPGRHQTGDYRSVNSIETAGQTTRNPDPSYDLYLGIRLLSKLAILDKLYIFCYSVPMQTVSATHAKQNFAVMLDQSQREPVMIQRHERDIAVVISAEEYERMHQNRWAEFNRLSALAAKQAKANGLTEEILAEILAG